MSRLDFANLTIDGQSLLLPQSDVRHIELIDNILSHEQDNSGTGLGVVEHDHRHWPVFSLNRELSPLVKLPEQRRLVACIAADQHYLALACDMVTTIQFDSEYIFDALPEMMRIKESPIQALLYADETLHYISGGKPLIDFLLNGED